ncbi:MAG: hypothetical protein KTV77_04155 [Wolbachia endosymbiont of Fragariocoptes setiger]|nr:hypothetical protein [Wolbachia endosymbiont of Fragariocoptes setiger]
MAKIYRTNNQPILSDELKKLNLIKLRATQNNELAHSGQTMFLDFDRMNFVINGKKIDKQFIASLKNVEGSHNSEEVWFDALDNQEEIWFDASDSIEMEEDYRTSTKEIFKRIFRDAEAEIPSDSILEELITNCNQAGYEGALFIHTQLALGESFMVESDKRLINIECINSNNVKIRLDTNLSLTSNMDSKKFSLPTSVEFTLKSQNRDDNLVTYTNGKLSLTLPDELKSYEHNSKNLFNIIKEYFKKLCAKLGFNLEIKIQTQDKQVNDLGNEIKVSSGLDRTMCILEKNLQNELSLSQNMKSENKDIREFIETKIPIVSALISDCTKLEDNQENRDLLIDAIANNLGFQFQDKRASEILKESDINSMDQESNNTKIINELVNFPSLIKGSINHNQVQSAAKTFASLILHGKEEVYTKGNAINSIDAIRKEIDKTIIMQEEKESNKQEDVENTKWTDIVRQGKPMIKSR